MAIDILQRCRINSSYMLPTKISWWLKIQISSLTEA